jgi:AcrR family transcriptional regulator
MKTAATTIRIDMEKVISMSIEMVDREGLDSLTLSGLAQNLGIKPPSLYTHIDSLAGLRRLIGLRGLEDLNERITRAIIGLSGEEALTAAAFAYKDFVRAHPGLYAAGLPTAPEKDREWWAAVEKIQQTLRLCLKGFKLDKNELIHVERGFRCLVHGFVMMELSGALKNRVDKNTSFTRSIDIFLAGIKSLDSGSIKAP